MIGPFLAAESKGRKTLYFKEKKYFALNRFKIVEPKMEVQAAVIVITHLWRKKTSLIPVKQ
jgi:hypothetical protein